MFSSMWEVGSSPGIVSSGQWPHAFLCWSSQCQGRWFRGPNNAESQPWEAKSLGHSHRKVSFIPRGFSGVTRVEELSFPNGRIYKMKSTLVRDTEYSLMDSKCTQTDDVSARFIPIPLFPDVMFPHKFPLSRPSPWENSWSIFVCVPPFSHPIWLEL